jgi:hypothetical protein
VNVLFFWLINNIFLSQQVNTNHQAAVFFSYNKLASATSQSNKAKEFFFNSFWEGGHRAPNV